MSKKYLYYFSEGNNAFGGDKVTMKNTLGGKGAGLAEMTAAGMPVPQGFTITTEACTQYYKDDHKINAEIQAEIMEYVDKIEEMTGKKFGDLYNPLLVSVRSGARASMPGMMDTILNLGLNDEVVVAFAKKTNNPRFAYDSYRRFIQMYSDVVMEVGKKYFEQLIDEMKEKKGVKLDTELDANDLKELAEKFKAEYKDKLGEEFPQDPKMQLMGAIKAVFRSWDNPRAIYYRRMNDIPSDWGTAVNVPVHGLRQYRRYLRHGRRVYPQPRHRRKEAVRRVPDERAGRRRRGRRPYPADHRPAGRGHARGIQAVYRYLRQARISLPRHAGYGVHH